MFPTKFTTFLQARKPSTVLFLLFLSLPSLFFFLIFVTFAFFLFLPIICILISMLLAFAIVRRIPILSLLRGFLNHKVPSLTTKDDQMVENMPVSVEFDQSEVPSFTDKDDQMVGNMPVSAEFDQSEVSCFTDNDDQMVDDMPVSVEFDQSEVPSFTESESGSESGEDFSYDRAEMIRNLWPLPSFKPVRRGEDKPFHEILSFWKGKERVSSTSFPTRLASW